VRQLAFQLLKAAPQLALVLSRHSSPDWRNSVHSSPPPEMPKSASNDWNTLKTLR
jgi:hypothetical protein